MLQLNHKLNLSPEEAHLVDWLAAFFPSPSPFPSA